MPDDSAAKRLHQALWRLYQRPQPPTAGDHGGNLPWDDPAFSHRMLREHLDDSHGAATRTAAERGRQLAWFQERLALRPGDRVLDLTCGPGLYAVTLAETGLDVTGIDFAPAAVAHARALAAERGVADRCRIVAADIRDAPLPPAFFDAALILYGQLAVFNRADATRIVRRAARALRPGGRLLVELLDPARIDRKPGSWWFTDDTGLWGETPFLHLGERHWNDALDASLERYYIFDLGTGEAEVIQLDDYAYTPEALTAVLREAGFGPVRTWPGWDGLDLYDADEWIVYLATRDADSIEAMDNGQE